MLPRRGPAALPLLAAGPHRTPLTVPAGEGGGGLSVPRTLDVPPGWTVSVWARVPGARMEA